MLRAHYRETPKLQAGRSKKGKDNGSKERRKEEKGKKGRRSERGGASLPRVPRSKDIPKIENFPKTPEFLNSTRGTVI